MKTRHVDIAAPGKKQTRRGWGLRLTLLAGMALVALAFVCFRLGEDADERGIRLQRAENYATASLGLALPGTPDLANLDGRLASHGVKLGTPVFIRIFKRDFELELWMMRDGRFHRFATYPICRWSGKLGPKIATGDHQAPEGFYTVDAGALNPNSRWHRSFNLGFPNAFDSAFGRTGSFLMVHGGCGSVGCYAMTNAVIGEIWRVVKAALNGGQRRFQVQVFPFRMSEANLERYQDSRHKAFWREIKAGHDAFEAEYLPPRVRVCGKRYQFEPAGSVADGSEPIVMQCAAEKPAIGRSLKKGET